MRVVGGSPARRGGRPARDHRRGTRRLRAGAAAGGALLRDVVFGGWCLPDAPGRRRAHPGRATARAASAIHRHHVGRTLAVDGGRCLRRRTGDEGDPERGHRVHGRSRGPRRVRRRLCVRAEGNPHRAARPDETWRRGTRACGRRVSSRRSRTNRFVGCARTHDRQASDQRVARADVRSGCDQEGQLSEVRTREREEASRAASQAGEVARDDRTGGRMKRKKAKRVRARVKKAAVATPTLIGGALLFKVLSATGASCHGGSMQWSLPDGDKPGEWHDVSGELTVCARGIHLTDEPARWYKPGCKVYVVEAEGVIGECKDHDDRKVVARRVRLLREASETELVAVCFFTGGAHQVRGPGGGAVGWGRGGGVGGGRGGGGDGAAWRRGKRGAAGGGDRAASWRGNRAASWRGDRAASWRGNRAASRRGNRAASRPRAPATSCPLNI